jgi:predicted Ser/Thr protein kinase/predicted esterase
MDKERWRKVEELYHAARALSSQRQSVFLNELDPELRREVEQLLAENGSHFDRPGWNPVSEVTATIFQPGTRLGRYEIEALLGAGGMGQVFRARDTQLGRTVAIKTSSEVFRDRFQIEARAISALNHPHICTLYDAGPNYLVMELVEGESLSARLKKGQLSRDEVLRYATEIAEALSEAHAHSIVHRDLKPANIMLTRHGAKVLDFGLAKMLQESGITQARVALGTPAYMAPEQVTGREATAATDLFALGLTIYEMAAGKLPVPGASLGQTLAIGAPTSITPLSTQRADLPAALDGLVRDLLAADPAQRPSSAVEVVQRLSVMIEEYSAPPSPRRMRLAAITGGVALLVLLIAGGLFYRRFERIRWEKEEAIPRIALLSHDQPLAAFLLLRKAEEILPGDPQLANLEKSNTRLVSVAADTADAKVEIQDYIKPAEWLTLGKTPLRNIRIPSGYFRWRVSKPGEGDYISAPATQASMSFPLEEVHRLPGEVPVAGRVWGDYIDFIGWVIYRIPNYDIDRFEVTNAQYQKFVDEGGYRKPEYWKEKFVQDGKDLTWEQAMESFRDPTGRPGPSTWEAGHYPQGQSDYPVSGVSWYEAAAYAAFAGRSLPVLGQWYNAEPGELAPYAANAGNFDGKGPARVGSFPSEGPFGTYDMAGNVREWSLTAMAGERFILGGAWRTQTYQSFDPETLPPFDRSPLNGFRTVRNREPLPPEAAVPVVRQGRDFTKEMPVSDDVFQAYKAMYAYDPAALRPQAEAIDEDTADWTRQKITIDAGYDGQRLPMFLFLPKNVRPPFQAVVFFPSARVELINSSHVLGDMQFVDYVIRSGRALLYPVYNGTYERAKRALVNNGSIQDLQMTIQRSKEVRRAVDYLVTRPDIDSTRLAYVGVSMGAAYGVIFTALEDRFRTAILLDGGFFLGRAPKGRDQLDFAPHLLKPVLMINGKYDFSFSPERAQEPMFRLIGTDAAHKRRVVFDSPHDISQQKNALSKEALAWLDQYLGRVN